MKPHRSQPLEEGVLHGEAPSSAPVNDRDSRQAPPVAMARSCPELPVSRSRLKRSGQPRPALVPVPLLAPP